MGGLWGGPPNLLTTSMWKRILDGDRYNRSFNFYDAEKNIYAYHIKIWLGLNVDPLVPPMDQLHKSNYLTHYKSLFFTIVSKFVFCVQKSSKLKSSRKVIKNFYFHNSVILFNNLATE